MPLRCKECGYIFPICARKSEERRPKDVYADYVRIIVDKPCCPKCESINIEEVKGP